MATLSIKKSNIGGTLKIEVSFNEKSLDINAMSGKSEFSKHIIGVPSIGHNSGIFTEGEIEFVCGDVQETFEIPELPHFYSSKELDENWVNTISEIRKWVEAYKNTETVSEKNYEIA